ncbi:MAG: MmgE/PrpD family protein, partial [Alphaproteobacteria bacterium]|nr:MmgE/PrpD family protein [Alphaproteobacteria bacterium]
EAIRLEGGEVQRMLFHPEAQKKRPATAIDAKFSLPFTVALALVRGRVTLDDIDEIARCDPRLLEVASRVDYRQRPDWGRDRAASAAVELDLCDGRTLRAELDVPLGHPDRPLTDDQLRAKFLDCAARARRPLTADAAGALADSIMRFDEIGDIGPLLASM